MLLSIKGYRNKYVYLQIQDILLEYKFASAPFMIECIYICLIDIFSYTDFLIPPIAISRYWQIQKRKKWFGFIVKLLAKAKLAFS